jgi:hypothetical protein
MLQEQLSDVWPARAEYLAGSRPDRPAHPWSAGQAREASNPTGVRYSSSGAPSAKARDGSRITFTGQGGWAGFLRLRVALSGGGRCVLRLWCRMPGVPKPRGHVGDGLSFISRGGLRFTDFRAQERTLEGVMFYGR